MRVSGAPARLLAALTERGECRPTVEEIHSRPWASATFSGARHHLRLLYSGDGADSAVGRLSDGLDEAEFDLGPDLLVDIALGDCHRDDEGTHVLVEALTIDAD